MVDELILPSVSACHCTGYVARRDHTGLFSFLLAIMTLQSAMLLSGEGQDTSRQSQAFSAQRVEGNVMYAVAAVVSATAPLFVLILFFQRQIVSGLTGAVKGKGVR